MGDLIGKKEELLRRFDFAKANYVALSVSYPLYNPATNEIKFSNQEQKTYPKVHQTGKGIRIFVPF